MINNFIKKIKEKKIIDNNNHTISYSWMWEFSKKVVVAIFVIYIVNYILCWSASFLSGIFGWGIPYIDTFITSTNETTQIVLGGYFVKAMAENVIKNKNKENINTNQEELLSDESDDDSSFDL